MTGIGSYFYIVWAIWLRLCLNEKQDEFMLHWPSMCLSLPEVIPIASFKESNRRAVSENGYLNGHAKDESRKSV
jgi:dihydroceramidase